MRPYYNHTSRENVTPSSGTSSLASHKEVPAPLPPGNTHLVVHNSSANMKRKMLAIQHQWKMVIGTDDKLTNDMRRINCSHFV